MPRFVLLEHDHPSRHWDFMLEAGPVLRTWRLFAPPTIDQAVEAESIGDHRRAYLDYEGPVSGDRGTVKRWDSGKFEWIEDGEQVTVVRLMGIKLHGTFRLERTADGERGVLTS